MPRDKYIPLLATQQLGLEEDEDGDESAVLEVVDDDEQEEAPSIPEVLPILPLKNTVVYPIPILLPLLVGLPRSIKLVDDVMLGNRLLGLVALKDASIDEPKPDDLYTYGSAASIARFAKAPDGTVRIFVQGIERLKIVEFTQTEPYLMARVELVPDVVEEGVEIEALMRNTVELFRRTWT